LAALKHKVLELCDCSVSLVSERFQCGGDNTAYLDVTLNGFMAGNIKELLRNKLTVTLDLQNATLYVCDDGRCLATTSTNVTNSTPQGDDGSDSLTVPITVIIFCLCALTIMVLFLIVAFIFSRYVMECHI